MQQEKSKSRFDLLIYLLLVAQIASLGVLNNITFLGRPIAAYVRYVVFFIALINLGLYAFEDRKNKAVAVWFLLSFLVVGTIGFINTRDIMNVLIEASHYVTIVALYYYIERHEYSLKTIITCIYILIPILTVTSLLSSFGFLNGMRDSSGGLLRNSADVDGTIGVVATLAVFHEINRKEKARLLDYCELIMGAMTVFFSLSRGRIAILLLCIAVYLLINTRNRKTNIFRKMIPIIILVVILLVTFSGVFGELVDQIVGRFSGTDIEEQNLTYRQGEMLYHLEIYKSNPLFGFGWGMLSRYPIRDHCSYTAVLAFMGTVGGIPYLCWFFWMLVSSLVKSFRERRVNNFHLTFIIMLAIMSLAVANMAFNKTGGVWGMLIAYTAFLEQPEPSENENQSENTKTTCKYFKK